ncbi:MAG: HYR domain-containing protein, partial [Phaeodactylibacter sp.]|nr:HYR domain-containing protein [Phaeodactylibacter sp.]
MNTDDCYAELSGLFGFRHQFPSSENVYNTSPTFGNSNHTWNIEYNWRYAYDPYDNDPLDIPCDYYESVTGIAGNIDAWVLNLTAGETYEFKVTSGADPFLRIYSSDGHTPVAQNDGYTNLLPRIVYTPSQSGIYFIEVSESSRSWLTQDATLLFKVVPPAVPVLTASETLVCRGTPVTLNLAAATSGAYVKKIQYCNSGGCDEESEWHDLVAGDTYVWNSGVSNGPFDYNYWFRGILEGICNVPSPIVHVELMDSRPTIVYGEAPIVCPGDSYSMAAVYDGARSCSIQWEKSDTGPTSGWSVIQGATNPINTGPLTATRWYRAKLVCPGGGCPQAFSDVQEVTVRLPDLTSTCPPNRTVSTSSTYTGDCGVDFYYNAPGQPGNCSSISVTQTAGLPSGSLFPVGTTTNTFLATDGSGNTSTCSFTVTVIDNGTVELFCADSPWTISIPQTPPGLCSVEEEAILFLRAIAYSDCSTPTVSGPFPGGPYEAGDHEITWRVENANGIQASCSHIIRVRENRAPIISCPANVNMGSAAGQCGGTTVAYDLPTATDNCGIKSLVQTGGLASGSVFPFGVTTNTFVATDVSNWTASCSFNVEVTDMEDPMISCPGNITVTKQAGECGVGAVIAYNAPTATDNCQVQSLNQTAGLASGVSFPLGTTTNTFVATDAAGNSASCSFTVTVEDCNLPPIAVCQNLTVSAGSNCTDAVTEAEDFDNGSSDPDMDILSFSVSSAGPYSLGTTNVTLTVSDPRGGSNTCTATITVVDDIPPTINCPGNISLGTDAGLCTAVATWASPTASDNCDVSLAPSSSHASGDAFPIGLTT